MSNTFLTRQKIQPDKKIFNQKFFPPYKFFPSYKNTYELSVRFFVKMNDFIQKSVGRFFSNFLQCMQWKKDNRRREKTELSDTFLTRQKNFKPNVFRHTKFFSSYKKNLWIKRTFFCMLKCMGECLKFFFQTFHKTIRTEIGCWIPNSFLQEGN